MNVLVTGANGQLGSAIKSQKAPQGIQFIYAGVEELDITDTNTVSRYFQENSFLYCINCAAYTAVDKAEEDIVLATKINAKAPENLALACHKHDVILIHISTDFVFDGNKKTPYLETDTPNPLSVYGQTKLAGELAIQAVRGNYFIIRTSWLYSEYGNNFLKTMLRLGAEREELHVVSDQLGTPTYAGDLAILILKIIEQKSEAYGLYHYSNEGFCSWFDFAKAIFKENNNGIMVHPISTTEYPTPAVRPQYSVLDKAKIYSELGYLAPQWEDSLKRVITLLG